MVVPPTVPTPGPRAWRHQAGVQAVLRKLLGCWCSAHPYRCSAHPHGCCARPPPGWGARVASPAAERGESEPGPSPHLACDEPARAQPAAPHGAQLGGFPLLGSRGDRCMLTPVRTGGGTRVPPPPLGWYRPRCCSTGMKPQGGAFGTWHWQPKGAVHRTAPYIIQHTGPVFNPCQCSQHPSHPPHMATKRQRDAREAKGDGKEMEKGPGDTPLLTWATLPWRRGWVLAWFTVHGPRDWLA